MITPQTFFRIQYESHEGHASVNEIARKLGLSPKTVTKWISRPEFIPQRRPRRTSKLDKFKPKILQLLKNEGLSADRIHILLQGQGYDGGHTILRSFISQHRSVLPVTPKEFYLTRWMHQIMQNAIPTSELRDQLEGKVSEEVLAALATCIRRRTLRTRNTAVAILATKKGISANSVAKFLCVTAATVSKWTDAFQKRGIQGLKGWQRTKPKKSAAVEYQQAVFSILHTPPSAYGFNRTSWRMEDIVRVMREKGLPLDKDGVRTIIRGAGFRFRQAKRVLTSNDPDYKTKLEAITKILRNLKQDEKFFSVDEFGPFAVKIQGGRSLVGPDEIRTVLQRQKSKGSLILTAALELSKNQVTHFYSDKKDTDEMIKLLEVLLANYADQSCIYFSWDAASWHGSKKFSDRVEEINSPEYRAQHKAPLVKLAPLPACAQFLNVIESVFSGMARAIIHNSDYQSVGECKAAINRHFLERNEDFKAHPKRAGDKIWGKELVPPAFNESNNCKDPRYRGGPH